FSEPSDRCSFPAGTRAGAGVTKTYLCKQNEKTIQFCDVFSFKLHLLENFHNLRYILEDFKCSFKVEIYRSAVPCRGDFYENFHAISSRTIDFTFNPTQGLYLHIPLVTGFSPLSLLNLTVFSFLVYVCPPTKRAKKCNVMACSLCLIGLAGVGARTERRRIPAGPINCREHAMTLCLFRCLIGTSALTSAALGPKLKRSIGAVFALQTDDASKGADTAQPSPGSYMRNRPFRKIPGDLATKGIVGLFRCMLVPARTLRISWKLHDSFFLIVRRSDPTQKLSERKRRLSHTLFCIPSAFSAFRNHELLNQRQLRLLFLDNCPCRTSEVHKKYTENTHFFFLYLVLKYISENSFKMPLFKLHLKSSSCVLEYVNTKLVGTKYLSIRFLKILVYFMQNILQPYKKAAIKNMCRTLLKYLEIVNTVSSASWCLCLCSFLMCSCGMYLVESSNTTQNAFTNKKQTFASFLLSEGRSCDFYWAKRWMKLLITTPKHLLIWSEANGGDKTFDEIGLCGERLAQEVANYLDNIGATNFKLSFVGFSLGCVTIRAALTCPQMRPYIKNLNTFLSLHGPHLGVLYANNKFLRFQLSLLSKMKMKGSMKQVAFQDSPDIRTSYIYILSRAPGFEYFKHVLLMGSSQDRIVPVHSSNVQHCTESLADNTVTGKAYEEMIENLLGPLLKREDVTLKRFDVFHDIGSLKYLSPVILSLSHVSTLMSRNLFEKFMLISGADCFN
ncbi:unnamed protein product, partial [Ixodes persulcatus]